LKYNDVYIFVL